MLRSIVAIVSIVFVAFALALTWTDRGGWPVLAVALLFAFACLYERRYHAGRAGLSPDARFRPTGERFADPETGRAMTVWADPATGERRYVADGEPPAPIP
jgi:hypothetical protein